jgi:NitT/TauT family transport system substrate-binding protein
MTRAKGIIFSCALLLVAANSFAATKLDSVTIGYSSFSGDYAPLWIAIENRLGTKYGLDLKVIYAGRIRPQQLLAGGEVPFIVATGTGVLTSHVLGVKDQVIVLTSTNKVPSALFTRPDIKSAEELRGKTIATGRPGAFGDTMVRYILKAKLGLTPDRDIKLVAIGEAVLAFPALEKGVVDGASLTMPYTLVAKQMGYRELIDYDKAGVVYPYNTVTTLRQTAAKNPEVLERVLKTMIEAISILKTNKEKSLAAMKKYMRGASEQVIEQTYEHTRAKTEEVPMPSLDVIKSGLEILSYQYPQAKQTDPNLLFDASFVRKIDQSGFIRALYKK